MDINKICKDLKDKKYIEIYEDGVLIRWFKQRGVYWIDYNDTSYSDMEIYIRVGLYIGQGFEVKSKY